MRSCREQDECLPFRSRPGHRSSDATLLPEHGVGVHRAFGSPGLRGEDSEPPARCRATERGRRLSGLPLTARPPEVARFAPGCLPEVARIAHARASMADAEIRAALDRRWIASNAGDDAGEGDIYRDDVELLYPQSGEHFRGRRSVLESRGNNPAQRRFEVRRTLGSGDLWVVEYVIFYDGRAVPTRQHHGVRRRKGRARGTQYFADPFEAPAWRAGAGAKRRFEGPRS